MKPNQRMRYFYELYIDTTTQQDSNAVSVNITNPPNAEILSARIELFKMSNTIYNIAAPNNTFEILTSSGNFTVVLTPNNYNAEQFVSELNTVLNSSSDSFSVNLDDQSGILTINNTSLTNWQINPNNNTYILLAKMGFNPDQTYIGVSGVISSIFPIDLSQQKIIFMDILELPTKNVRTVNNNKFNFYININCPFGGMITEKKSEFFLQPRVEFPEQFNILLYNEDGSNLNNNNGNYSLILKFELQDLFN